MTLRQTLGVSLALSGKAIAIGLVGITAVSCDTGTRDDGKVAIDPEAYFFVAEYGPMVGGMSSKVRVTYISASGLVQHSRETSHGELVSLKEGPTQTDTLFSDLAKECVPLPRRVRTSEEQEPALVEYYPASVNVVFDLPGTNSGPHMWSGDATATPHCLRKVIDTAHELTADVPETMEPASFVYIRAHLLHKTVVKEYLKADLFKTASKEDLEKEIYLKQAVGNPFRLIPVQGKDNAFAAFYSSFRPGRDNLKLSVEEGYFQIFSLIKATDKKRPQGNQLRGT